MILGTNHFVSKMDAYAYYNAYGFTRFNVDVKINAHEIEIGKPSAKPNQRVLVNKSEGRYFIEE